MKSKHWLLKSILIVICSSLILYLNYHPKDHNKIEMVNDKMQIMNSVQQPTNIDSNMPEINNASSNSNDLKKNENSPVLVETEILTTNTPDLVMQAEVLTLEKDLKELANKPLDSQEVLTDHQANQTQTPNTCIQDEPQKLHIFFDVGQVLLDNSSTGAAKAVGVSHMFWYTVKHKKTPESKDIQSRLFDFIDYCTKRPRGHALFNGQPLPGLMCDWAKGLINTQEILKIVTHYNTQAKEFFESEEEKNLVFGALNLFKPDVISDIQKPIVKMVNLFEYCCQNFPDQVYILSNWDRESAALIRKKFPKIFNLIPKDHIFFSGDIGELKPEKSAFNYVTDKLNINPKSCILIDDNAENIKMARSLGWKGIIHKTPERSTRKLKRLTKKH